MTSVPLSLASLIELGQNWLKLDPSTENRGLVEKWILQRDEGALRHAFATAPLTFGTAGLRGLSGPGLGFINAVVVARAVSALCATLREQVKDAQKRGICIGFDARRGSTELAQIASYVAADAGYRVLWFERFSPTPLVAFGVVHLRAAGGIVLTASHNPPDFLGLKLYWEDGVQLGPPHQDQVAAAMTACDDAWMTAFNTRLYLSYRPSIKAITSETETAYLSDAKSCALHPKIAKDVVIAYTAMHGVGAELTQRLLFESGFRQVYSVALQAQPDADFPTVDSPNPEDRRSLTQLQDLAERTHADVALAHDPDADRLAVMVRDDEDTWLPLGGNEVGLMLADYLLSHTRFKRQPLLVSTVVSSPLLAKIGADHNAHVEFTLTGFKWIMQKALEIVAQGKHQFVLGFEEAIGYAVSLSVRDKDGITAALIIAEMAAWYESRGLTLYQGLERLWFRYGLSLSRPLSIERSVNFDVTEFLDWFSTGQIPTFAGKNINHVIDYRHAPPHDLPKTTMVEVSLEDGFRIMIRPSGTEPKFKFYIDWVHTLNNASELRHARSAFEHTAQTIQDSLLRLVAK